MVTNDVGFQDEKIVRTVTPYKRLREMRGWSQEFAADKFHMTRRSMVDVENGRKDVPKDVIREMDREYGCGGKLIEYWWTKFSVGVHAGVFGAIKRICNRWLGYRSGR